MDGKIAAAELHIAAPCRKVACWEQLRSLERYRITKVCLLSSNLLSKKYKPPK